MAKVTLSDMAKLFKDDKKPSDFHYYGQIVSVDRENRTYEVSINRDESITVEAARLVGAGVGDTVMVTVMANGYATVTGRVGGDMDASDAQRTADNASDAASSALSQARSAAGTASQAQSKAAEALGIANNAVELAEQAEEEAGRASTAATQAAASASSAEADASRAATSAQNAEADASSASTSAQNAAASASSASTSASNAATSAQNAASDAASAATSASNAEADASSAATSAQNAARDASSASSSATAAAADAATARQQSSAATTAANEAKTQAQAAETAANEAKADASSAKRDAAAANTAANGAVAGLAVVQGVVDQLETDVDDMQTHVAMMNAIDDGDVHIPAGLHVVPSASGYFMVIANDGVYVYDNESVLVAKYGHNIVYDSNREHKIGNNTSYIRYYDSNNDGVADAIEIVADNIRLGSYSVGDKITATETTLNNYMSSNNTRVGNVETSVNTTTTNLTNYITSNNQAIESLERQIDGAIDTWYYSGVPTLNNDPAINWPSNTYESHERDLYFDTSTGHTYRFARIGNTEPYTYEWIEIQDADALRALQAAATAQDTADHKRRVFVTTPAPPYEIGDLWVQGQNGDIFRCATPKTSQQSYDLADWVKASKYTDDTKANAVESDLHANYYVKSDFSVAPDRIASTISATETTVKTYADGKASAAETNAKTYADGKASAAETNAKTYADGKASAAEQNAKDYADDNFDPTGSATTALNTAKTYADGKASTAENNAKAYADDNFDPVGSAASALDDAKDYADDNFDTKGSASAAQTAAISAAATDATTKANNAKDAAISAAATDATTKANSAKNAAITAAAADATSKANAAEANAKADTTEKLKSYYTKTQTDSAITQRAEEISLQVTENKVSQITYDEDNLLINADDLTKWTNENNISVEWDDEVGMYKITDRTHTSSRWGIYQDLDCSPNTYYTFSMDGMYIEGDGESSLAVGSFETTAAWPAQRETFSTERSRKSYTWKTGETHSKIRVYICHNATRAGSYFYAVRPKLSINATENAKAEIKVTTDAIESTVSNKVGNDEVISKIRQSAETVKIKANQVEIDGTATFNAIKSQADAAYDSKGSAETEGSKALSRGEQLVTNGSAILMNNTNFSSFIYDGSKANTSGGSFTIDHDRYVVLHTDEYFPINPDNKYRLTADAISAKGVGKLFTYPRLCDIDKLEIGAIQHMYMPGTLTTLTQDLKPGDTVVHFESLDNWNINTDTRSYQRGFIFWNYKNSFGYQYPENTYSRNVYYNLYADSDVDKTNNTITLTSAWPNSHGTIPAGTKLSQSNSGGSYKYVGWSGHIVPQTWSTRYGVIGGIDYTGQNDYSKFPPGAAYAQIGFLWNYSGTGNEEQIWATNVFMYEDYKTDIATALAKKSTHTLISTNTSGTTMQNLLNWSNEGASNQWYVGSTAGVLVGDTVRIAYKVSDISSKPTVYVVGTVTIVNNATTLTMISHGLDTTIIDGGNILTGTVTASQLNANDVKTKIVQTTELDASKITTGTLSADRIAAGSLTIGKVNGLQTTLDGKADDSDIPTKVTDLSDGSSYPTTSDLDDLLDAKQNAGDYITDSDFDERISDIEATVNTLNGQILFGDDGTNTFILLQNRSVIDNTKPVTGVQAKLTSEKLAFGTFGSVDNEVAYFSSEELKVQKRLSFGNFVMKQRDNGHLSIMFEGGDD